MEKVVTKEQKDEPGLTKISLPDIVGESSNMTLEDLLIEHPLPSNDLSYEWVQQMSELMGDISIPFPIHHIGEQIKNRDLDIEFRVRTIQSSRPGS